MTEAYADKDFWEKYKEFADESLPRHRSAFRLLTGIGPNHGGLRVLDLGCGKAFIGLNTAAYVWPYGGTPYHGIDTDPGTPGPWWSNATVAKGSYLDEDLMEKTLMEFQPTIVVSLFSTDVVIPPEESHKLYRNLLEGETVQGLFTAGFYYDDERRNMKSVTEVGGLTSYQVPRGQFLEIDGIKSSRLEIPAPSKLFGDNVVEVFTYYTYSSSW